MRKIILLVGIITLLLVLSGGAAAQDDRVTITIVNASDTAICTVAARLAGTNQWNQAEIPIVPGDQYEISVNVTGVYAVAVYDCDGNELRMIEAIDLTRSTIFTVIQAASSSVQVTLTIVNGFDVPICYVNFSLNTATTWGSDRLDETEIIPLGAERQWVIAPGIYDIWLGDCEGETLTETRQVSITENYRWDVAPAATATDRSAESIKLNDLGVQAANQGHYEEALAYFEQALVIVREISERAGEGSVLNNIGKVYENQGQYGQALDFYQQALAIWREIGDRADEVTALGNIGGVYHCQGQYVQALDYYQQALAIAREVGDRAGEGANLNNIGGVYDAQGQYGQALDYYQQALAIHREVGDRPGEGITLGNIGGVYRARGQYVQALDYHQQALVIKREVGDRAGEGTTLNNIGLVYHGQGQYGQALDYYQQALAIHREVGDRRGEGTTLNNIGGVYRDEGQNRLAFDYYQQALAIQREVGDPAGEGTTLNNIGLVYCHQGQYGQALDFYQQALAIVREVGDRPGEGKTLGNIGGVYEYQGQYGQALDFYQQALAIVREVGDRVDEGVTLSNIGGVYRARGQYVQALDYYQQALAIAREVGDRAGEGANLNNIGGVYDAQGQYSQALDYYQQALAIRREIGDRAGEGVTLNNIGAVYDAQGQYSQALDYHQQALVIAREVGDRAGEGTTLNNIGLVYHAQGQYGQALDYYQQALVIKREVGGRLCEGIALSNIGLVYRDQGQYGQALDNFQQALAIHREVGDRAGEGATLSSIGTVYLAQGQYDQALDHLQQALAIQREVGDRVGEGVTLSSIGLVYNSRGQCGEALDYYQQSLNIQREVGYRAGEGATMSSIGMLYDLRLGDSAKAVDYYQQTIEIQESLFRAATLDQAITSLTKSLGSRDLNTRLTSLLIQEHDLLGALEYAERGRGILLRDELRNGAIDFRASLDDQNLLAEEDHLRSAVSEAQNLVDAFNQDLSASNLDKQNAQTALDDARKAYERHLERMQLQGGFLAREIALNVASLMEIQAALPDDTTLILYGVGSDGGYVLLVTPNNLRGFILDATTEDIDHAVRAFAADRRANTAALQDLYDLVFAPLADEITTDHLIISPDGVLNYVPFAALQAPDGSYLIDHFTISMIPSGTVLVLLNEREPSGSGSSPGLVLAQRDAPGLPRLRNAYSEGETVANALGVTAITDASERDLREGSTGAEVIFISAHAELDRFAPLYSSIHLGEDDTYDGRVEVREIYELDLSQGTELVVLSGCETASGGTGEDFGLLSRAFFAAGVNEVVASLWSVDDTATADLLTAFIEARAGTDNSAEALRTAMLATREQYPEPYYWASFVLSGQP